MNNLVFAFTLGAFIFGVIVGSYVTQVGHDVQLEKISTTYYEYTELMEAREKDSARLLKTAVDRIKLLESRR